MTSDLYAELAWLPAPPVDFRLRCRDVRSSDAPGREFERLAKHALDENDLRRLASAIATVRELGRAESPLVPFRLGVIGNATLEPLIAPLVATAPRYGLALECVVADFGQTLQTALDPNSAFNLARPDAILLALDHHGLAFRDGISSAGSSRAAASESFAFVASLREGFRRNAGASCIVTTLAPPPETLFGSFDACIEGTLRRSIDAYNTMLIDSVRDTSDVLFDVRALAETVGTGRWHSPEQWNLAKLAFDTRFIPLFADHACRIVAAMRGKSRRCLILDLDNTLWGGVVGDDGLEGIALAHGDAVGEAFLAVQRAALALRDRGIVLAVSSKNDDAVARRALAEHPEMLLREHHFAAVQANWQDKATNIVSIAEALSLGLDAMVFLDDNPAERALVRAALPAVAVPELPEDPASFARVLAAAGYFEAVTFSAEDRARASSYADNARRVALLESFTDLPAYLASLDMEIVFKPFDVTGRARIVQLINKSNQFNLTTRRYTETDVAELERDANVFTLAVRLVDRFGDNGMIGVNVVRRIDAATWMIDTWLMSCRVLGRRVEQMVLRELLANARSRGIERVVGIYIPSERNAMVAKHYEKLGFTLVETRADGTTEWEIAADADVEEAPMRVDRSSLQTVR